MSTINISTLKTKDLIALYNQHSGKAPITAWKRKVSDLVATLVTLQPDLFTAGAVETFEAPADELASQSGRPVDHTEAPAPTKSKPAKAKKTAKKAKKEANSDRGAIRRFCEEQLLKVKGTDPETKRPMGLAYADILAAVTTKFPEAETSLNCLRWYATKMNKRTGAEKVQMPTRPKAKPEAVAA